ncbi:methionyl-tRNA formyltransferase [Motiliproteus sp.]|uniref:methionyl-tRNA formyltransferase n=1 Tax=Motiliproteus sp. TaxID=1898955 RepID=UPI003BAD2471
MTQPPLRIVFAGTPDFAAASLEALINSRHQVVAVYTQPDRPAGRGKKLTPSPVKRLAQETGIPVCQPISLKSTEEQQLLAQFKADLMVVVAYGLLLPKAILETPRLGCINVHASLLPRWRGAAPIERALMAGDPKTGITIMQMDEGLDTGDMLHKVECPIHDQDTAGNLHDRLLAMSGDALLTVVEQLADGSAQPEPQNHDQANYAHKLLKGDRELDWSRSAMELSRQIRGLNPSRVAFSYLGGQRIGIWNAQVHPSSESAPAGQLLGADNQGLLVATGAGVLQLTHLQLPGGRQLPVADLLNSRQDLFRAGNHFGQDD